ncbi:MAG: hypothetical protein FWE58_06060, partial [Methanobrevibacter sp.]|nr:hypothetical protein [Methanobrevibacter sp.]
MMKNKNVNRPILVIIAIILLFAFSLQFSFATSINDTDDEGIKGALDSDDSVGTIHLNPGTYSGINNTNITVNKNVTFQGNGSPDRVVIDGENSNWLFNIQDNLTVKFINITFRNAVADNGAAIFNGFSSNVKFINCIFENNFAVNGGAIYNNKGTISVENSLFTNNQASNGGAIYNNGFFSVVGSNLTNNVAINGGAIYNNGYVRLSDSNLTYNVANIGGAVYNNENIIISNCEFFKNTALGNDLFIQIGPNSREVLSLSYKNVDDLAYLILSENIHGGAIYNHNDGQIKIYNSVFDYNNANDGGAIYNNGDIRIYDSTFVYNYANKGGAIYNNGNMTVFDGNFTDNIAVGIFGVIYNYAESQIRDGDTENPLNNPEDPLNNPENILDNIQIDGVSFGGAIYNSGKFTLIDSNFTYNNANVGGAIYNSGDVVASNCNFIDNYATSYNTYNLLIRENQQPREILQSSYENENLGDNENLNENENLGDNENLENNGRLSSGFRINRPGDNGLIISVTSFGGAIYNNGTFTLRGSNFTNNSANFGGAIYNSGDMDVSNCNFVENYALANCVNEMLAQANQRPQDILQLLDGGEVSRDIGDSENNFQINRAADDAAGLAIRNSLINSINVPSFGGAIYNSGTFTLSGSNFTNNSANSGGAIYNSGDMTVSGSNFIDNYATGFIRDADMAREMMRDAESQDNLRILSAADDAAGLELDRSSFGGAIYNNGTFTLRGSNFTNNSANFGGAIYNSGDMTASNCNFIENYASDRSQGILQLLDGNDMSRDIGDSESNLQINRNTDDADDAAGLAIRNSMNVDSFGGAIYNSGTFTLSGSNFTNNSANFGGAIYNSGNMNASNCNFVENYALAQYANNILAQANQRPQAILQLLDGGEVSRDIGDSENNFQINRAADDAAGLA